MAESDGECESIRNVRGKKILMPSEKLSKPFTTSSYILCDILLPGMVQCGPRQKSVFFVSN